MQNEPKPTDSGYYDSGFAHPYIAELCRWAKNPTPGTPEDYARHKRLMAEALPRKDTSDA